MNFAHLHLLLNHFPIIGTILALGLLLISFVAKNDEWKRASLGILVFLALLTVPAFMSGIGAAQVLRGSPGVSGVLITRHQSAAMLALLFMGLTGALSLVALWQFRGTSRPSSWNLPVVLLFSIVTVGLMARTGNMGGEIRHPEIVSGQTAVGTRASTVSKIVQAFEPSPSKAAQLMTANKWWWAFMMDLHFIGLALLIGTVGVLDLRVLGFARQLSIAQLQKLIPWGMAGFGINVLTGMLAFIGMPLYYSYDSAFWLKMLFILVAAGNFLFLYCSDALSKWEALGPGENAPALAKLIAGTSLFLWFGVLILGRYIQFFADTIPH